MQRPVMPFDPSSIPGAVRFDYTPNPVEIPSSFLTGPRSTAPSSRCIDFPAEGLPEYQYAIAHVIKDVLSSEECAQLIKLAESSVRREDGSQSAWRPALIAVGDGWEVPVPGYRVSDRIIWDQQEVADRIWNRCLMAAEVRQEMEETICDRNGYWKLHSLNERLRFLKYTENQYFQPHCDSATDLERDGKSLRTYYTLQLYLNDSAAASPTGEGFVGGATTFQSQNGDRRLDIHPQAGTALIFQHIRLLHEGMMVTKGVKYTVRSDVFYEWVEDPEPEVGGLT